jgi:hypothetical protein
VRRGVLIVEKWGVESRGVLERSGEVRERQIQHDASMNQRIDL